MASPPSGFVARERAAAVSFDGKLFIFGGSDDDGDPLNSGAIYDPATDAWSLVTIDALTPTPRQFATALWTNTKILVSGGWNPTNGTYFRDAALYDPASDHWSAAASSPLARAAAHGGVTETTAVLGGGLTTGGGAAASADRYDINTNTWTPTSKTDAPKAVLVAAWSFAGEQLFVYGGYEGAIRVNRATSYNAGDDTWTSLPPAPFARTGAFGVTDGTRFYVWGGQDGAPTAILHNDGAWLPTSSGTAWTNMAAPGAPTARWAPPRQSGWAFALGVGDLAFLGGQDAVGGVMKNGGRYRNGPGWTPIPVWPSGEQHLNAVCVRVGKEILLWGGSDDDGPTTTGERWSP